MRRLALARHSSGGALPDGMGSRLLFVFFPNKRERDDHPDLDGAAVADTDGNALANHSTFGRTDLNCDRDPRAD